MGYSRKNQTGGRGGWGHTCLKPLLTFLVYLLYPWKFQANQSSTSGNCAKLRYIPCKFQDQKPLEISHAISLIPLEVPYPQSTPCLFFSVIAQCKEGFFYLILVGISSILVFSVKNRGLGGGVAWRTKPDKCYESYLLALPKLTVCVKSVAYIQNTLGG